MKLYVLMSVFAFLGIYIIPHTHARPQPEVKPKQKYGPSKKLRFKQWINSIMSLDDDSNDTDTLRESLTSLTVITDFTTSNDLGPPITDHSPISQCVQICYGNTSSINVSVLHTCNHECMLNPHRFDHLVNVSDHSQNTWSGARKRRYSRKT